MGRSVKKGPFTDGHLEKKIDALNTELDGSSTSPSWSFVPAAASSSYQRTSARWPSALRTVCWVQIASSPEASGSWRATA